MINEATLDNTEQAMVDNILDKMGIADSADQYKDEVKATLEIDYENNEHLYNNIGIVDKPEFVKHKEKAEADFKRGQTVKDGNRLSPLKNIVIAKMEPDREKITKSGIYIADDRSATNDNPKCKVVSLNIDSEYDFKVGDNLLIDLRYIKHRYFYDKFTHFVFDKEGVLGVYE